MPFIQSIAHAFFNVFRSLVKNCPEFIRTSMLTFFNNTADDLGQTIQCLTEVNMYLNDFKLDYTVIFISGYKNVFRKRQETLINHFL